MHIRMLVLTFFMKYYPDLIRRGHVHILQTPLFRVKNKKENYYCYDIPEKEAAIAKLKGNCEITRFKGLGEISSDEFSDFIGDKMRLDRVKLAEEESISEIMEFYMGDDTTLEKTGYKFEGLSRVFDHVAEFVKYLVDALNQLWKSNYIL